MFSTAGTDWQFMKLFADQHEINKRYFIIIKDVFKGIQLPSDLEPLATELTATTTSIDEHSQNLLKVAASDKTIFLEKEFKQFKSVISDVTQIFKQFNKLDSTLLKNPSTVEQFQTQVKTFHEAIKPFQQSIARTIQDMKDSSASSWKNAAKYILLGACAELAILTMATALIAASVLIGVGAALTVNPVGLFIAGTLMTSALGLAAVSVVAGVALYHLPVSPGTSPASK